MPIYRPSYDQSSGAGDSVYEIVAIDPPQAELDATFPTFAITGVGDFVDGCSIAINGALQETTFISPVRLNCPMPAGITSESGTHRFTVVGPLGTSRAFPWYVRYPIPTFAGIALTSTDLSGAFVPAEGEGTGITADTVLNILGYELPITYVSDTEFTVDLPIAIFDTPGEVSCYISNPAPGGGNSEARTFFAPYRPPQLDDISPSTTIIGRGDKTVLATGERIFADTKATVDGVEVSTTYLTPTTVSFVIPAAVIATLGNKTIRLTNPTVGGGGGPSVESEVFEVFEATAVALSISDTVQYFDGFDLYMTGEDFDPYFEVTYNGVAQPTTFVDANTLLVSVTSAACSVAGTTDVRARDTLSGVSTNALVFTVAAWTPTQIGSGLRLWLNGTSLVDDGSGRASQWSDMSGGGRHITQPTSGKRPLIVSASTPMNGQPAARFVSTRQDNFSTGLSWLTVGTAGIINKGVYNIWCVQQNASTVAGATIGETAGYIHVGNTITTPNRVQMRDDNGVAGVFPTITHNWMANTAYAVRATKTSLLPTTTATVSLRINRGTPHVLTNTNSTAFNPISVFIGSISATGVFWNGDISEVIVCNVDLNYTFKAIIDNMLSYKYGLPFGTPGAAPTITSLSPSMCTQLDAPFVVDVYDTGNSFTTDSIVNVAELPLPTTYVNAGHLQARIPQRYLFTSGGRAITVADVGGISGPKGITVLPYVGVPGPNIHSLTPSTALRFDNAMTGLIVTGVGFTLSSVVYADGVACATTFNTANQLTYNLTAAMLHASPGPVITVHDGAYVSNGLELALTDWTPANVLGLSCWLCADDVTLGTGTEVAQINDKSGYSRHFTQATASKRPLLIASDVRFNGRPTIDFDGVDDYMTGPSLSALFTPAGGTGNGQTTCGVAFRADAITGTGVITAPYNNNCVVGAAGGGFGLALRNTPIAYAYENDGAYQVATCAVAATTTSQAMILASPTTAGTNSLSINRVAGTPDTYASLNHGAPLASLGSNLTFVSNFLNGQIAEVFYSTVQPTAQDLICWANYCTYKYGTP